MGKFEFMGDKRNKHSGSKGSNVMGQSGMERERADVRERKWNCWWKKVEGDSENSRIVLWKNYRICTTIVYYEYGNTMEQYLYVQVCIVKMEILYIMSDAMVERVFEMKRTLCQWCMMYLLDYVFQTQPHSCVEYTSSPVVIRPPVVGNVE